MTAMEPTPSEPATDRGAACAIHPDREAVFTCARCGTFGCSECAFATVRNRTTCRACAASGLPEPIPWEHRKSLGYWKAFVATCGVAARQPTRFFRTPAGEDGLWGPVSFGMASYTFGQLLFLIILCLGLVASGIGFGVAADNPSDGAILAGVSIGYAVVLVGTSAVQMPMYALLGIFAGGGLSHLTLKLMKKATASFEETARVVSYANAAYFYYWIPCVGPLFSLVWVVRLETIALRELHGCGTDRALVAALGYRILLFVLVVGVYVGLIALIIRTSPEFQTP
ncbi:MAG: hypothetical protein AAGF12_13935 [Myxococcota bacterium]